MTDPIPQSLALPERRFLLVERLGKITKISNQSDFDVFISIKPVKPKRKIIDFLLVKNGCHIIDESEIDLTQIYISFTSIK